MNNETLQKLKCLALDEMNLSPVMDTYGMRKPQKDKLIAKVIQLHATLTPEDIDSRFTRLVNDNIFHPSTDISTYPVREPIS